MGRRLRTTFLIGVVVGLVLALVRARTRDAGRAPASLAPAAPALPVVTPRPTPETVPVAAAEATVAPDVRVEPEPVVEAGATWVAPVEGGCPDGYPVKAKESSKIFHVPGGLSYDRTRPDRCYPDATTAEADGFRPAKR